MCEHIPYLILPVRQLSSEPFGSRRSVRRSAEPKRYTPAVWHAAWHASHHPPKRYERAVGQDAGHVSYPPLKRRERAVGQDAGHVSYPPPKGHGGAVGQYAGPVSNRTIRRCDTRKLSGGRRACAERPPTISRASRCHGTVDEPLRKPLGSHRASAVHRAICRAIRCRRPAEIEPNPLDYSL